MKPIISVIVPCRNEVNDIEACVRSILTQDTPPGGFELIIADGMSEDGTRDILKRLAKDESRLRIIDNHARTVSSGLNKAICAAQGEIIIRMDSHTKYAPDYLIQCLSVLQETGADNVGGPARTESTRYMEAVISAAYHSPFAVGGARFHDVGYEGPVDTVPYGCWPRKVFDWIGFFDEELVRNQDDEFNLRLTQAGGRIWQSTRIKSWYRPRGSLKWLFCQYLQYGYWKVRVIQKHKTTASLRHLVPGCFVSLLMALPIASLWWPRAALLWLALLGAYTAGTVSASLMAAARHGWKFLPVLPLVFVCYHFAYGLGFLRGIYDFVILRRGPALGFSKLTRPSASS